MAQTLGLIADVESVEFSSLGNALQLKTARAIVACEHLPFHGFAEVDPSLCTGEGSNNQSDHEAQRSACNDKTINRDEGCSGNAVVEFCNSHDRAGVAFDPKPGGGGSKVRVRGRWARL